MSLILSCPNLPLYCPLLPSTAVYCPLLPSTAVYCPLLPSTALYCPSTALYCILPLPSHPLSSIVLSPLLSSPLLPSLLYTTLYTLPSLLLLNYYYSNLPPTSTTTLTTATTPSPILSSLLCPLYSAPSTTRPRRPVDLSLYSAVYIALTCPIPALTCRNLP
jgi:hypothetical protein